MTEQKIDLVYMWVDDNDKKWQAAKNYWLQKTKNVAPICSDSIVSARWRDNNELKYSLRSAELFAPWINHIYLVTGFNQVPSWLDTTNPKITIIPHEQIMPADALPTFNSVAIEMCIMNIPNLSEHFLLVNDDMFFNKPIDPSFFYDKRGRAIVWYTKNKQLKNIGYGLETVKSDYRKTILMAAHKIISVFGKHWVRYFRYAPAHNIDPYIKSTMITARNHPMLNHDIDIQTRNKFRTDWEMQRWLFNLYDVVHNRAVFRRARHFKKPKHFIYNLIHYDACKKSPIYCEDASHVLYRLSPYLFCINDTAQTTDEMRKQNRFFLETKFPNKSSFEK